MTSRYLSRMKARGSPPIVDVSTGAIVRVGMKYPERGGGYFEIVRVKTDHPARVLIRQEPKIGFGRELLNSSSPSYRGLGFGRLAFELGGSKIGYQWIPVRRIQGGRFYVSLPPIDFGRLAVDHSGLARIGRGK